MGEIIFTANAPKPVGAYSQGIRANGFIFVSGQIPVDMATGTLAVDGVHKNAGLIMRHITAILEAAGSSLKKTVKLTVFLKNIDDIKAVNEVLTGIYGEALPARAAVEVSRLPKNAEIEIEAIAEA